MTEPTANRLAGIIIEARRRLEAELLTVARDLEPHDRRVAELEAALETARAHRARLTRRRDELAILAHRAGLEPGLIGRILRIDPRKVGRMAQEAGRRPPALEAGPPAADADADAA